MNATKKTAADRQRDDAVEIVAQRCLDLETLTARNVDRLDFHELGVWSIKAALEAAYEAGRKSAGK